MAFSDMRGSCTAVTLALLVGGSTASCSVSPASSPPGAEGGTRDGVPAPHLDASTPERMTRDAAPHPSNRVPDAAPSVSPPAESGTGPCSAPGLLVCDDFEAMAVGAPPAGYVLESGGGTPGEIVVTDQTAHGGRHSVSVNGPLRVN